MKKTFIDSGTTTIARRVAAPAAHMAISFILFSAAGMRAQPLSAGAYANDFVSVEYYDPPHQRQIKSRMSGAQAQPEAGGMLLINQLKLETFSANGELQITAEAPSCLYDPVQDVARSPGPLRVRTGDGKFRVEGEGFLWRQSDSFLMISNRVETVIKDAVAIAP